MKKLKRLLIGYLILCFSLSGCDSLESKEIAGQLRDTVKLRWALFDWYGNMKPFEDSVNRILENNNLPYQIEFVNIPGEFDGDYEKYINTYLSELKKGNYDLVSCRGRYGNCYDVYEMAVDAGVLWPIEGWLAEVENGKRLRAAYPELVWESLIYKRHIYGVGVPSVSMEYYAVFNEAYAEKYEINLTADAFSDLEEGLKKAAEGEAEENNSKFIPSTAWPYFLYGDYEKSRCELICINTMGEKLHAENILENESYLSHMRRLRDWTEQGLIHHDPDFSQITEGNFLVTGIEAYSEAAAESFCRNRYKISDDIPLKAVKLEEFCRHYERGNGVNGIAADSRHKEEAKDILAAIHSDEALSNGIVFGTEGLDYEIIDGRAVIPEEEKNYLFIRKISFGNPFLTLPTEEEPLSKSEDMRRAMENAILGYSSEITNYSDERKKQIAAINTVLMEKYAAALRGKSTDWENDLEKLRAEVKSLGMDDILEEINRQLHGQ